MRPATITGSAPDCGTDRGGERDVRAGRRVRRRHVRRVGRRGEAGVVAAAHVQVRDTPALERPRDPAHRRRRRDRRRRTRRPGAARRSGSPSPHASRTASRIAKRNRRRRSRHRRRTRRRAGSWPATGTGSRGSRGRRGPRSRRCRRDSARAAAHARTRRRSRRSRRRQRVGMPRASSSSTGDGPTTTPPWKIWPTTFAPLRCTTSACSASIGIRGRTRRSPFGGERVGRHARRGRRRTTATNPPGPNGKL